MVLGVGSTFSFCESGFEAACLDVEMNIADMSGLGLR